MPVAVAGLVSKYSTAFFFYNQSAACRPASCDGAIMAGAPVSCTVTQSGQHSQQHPCQIQLCQGARTQALAKDLLYCGSLLRWLCQTLTCASRTCCPWYRCFQLAGGHGALFQVCPGCSEDGQGSPAWKASSCAQSRPCERTRASSYRVPANHAALKRAGQGSQAHMAGCMAGRCALPPTPDCHQSNCMRSCGAGPKTQRMPRSCRGACSGRTL